MYDFNYHRPRSLDSPSFTFVPVKHPPFAGDLLGFFDARVISERLFEYFLRISVEDVFTQCEHLLHGGVVFLHEFDDPSWRPVY